MSTKEYGINIAAIVPARKGSTRLKDKNGRPFGGKDSLIEWKISQLQEVLPNDKIYLTTEAEDYKEIGRNMGVNIHNRPAVLSDENESPFSEVLSGVVGDIKHDHIMWCTVTSPLMSPAEYKESIENYKSEVVDGAYDSLVGVNLLQDYLWGEDAPLNYDASAGHVYSQYLDKVYKVTNGIHIRNRDDLLSHKYYLGPHPYKQELSRLAGVDIDYLEEFKIAEALLPLYLENTAITKKNE